jgi:hypothetical protein
VSRASAAVGDARPRDRRRRRGSFCASAGRAAASARRQRGRAHHAARAGLFRDLAVEALGVDHVPLVPALADRSTPSCARTAKDELASLDGGELAVTPP